MSKIELIQAVSAEAQLKPNFKKPHALTVRYTTRKWERRDAGQFLLLVDNAHEQYRHDPSTEVFEYTEPFDPSLVDLFTGTLIGLTVGKAVHSGKLLPQTSHNLGDGGVLKYKLFNHPMLFTVLRPEVLTSPAVAHHEHKVTQPLSNADANRQALNDFAPYMAGGDFDAGVWLEKHWVTVRNALAK